MWFNAWLSFIATKARTLKAYASSESLPRLGKLYDRVEHTLAQLTLHRSILQRCVQRLPEEVLNLIAMQHAHPLAPQRCAGAL